MSYDGGRVTPFQIFMMTIGFLNGTATILARTGPAEQDSWLAVLLGGSLGFLYMVMYLAILKRFPGKTIIEIAQIALGRIGGMIWGLLFFWYSLDVAAMALRNIAELMTNGFFPENPRLSFIIPMLILSAVSVKSGVETIARTSEIVLVGPIFVPVIVSILAITNGIFHPSHLLPLLNHNFKTMAEATLMQLGFPFGEAVILTMVLGLTTDFRRGSRAALGAILMTSLLGAIIIVREIGVLGAYYVQRLLFPGLDTIRLVHIGEFLDRIEALFLFTWIGFGFFKVVLCHYAASVSLGQILGLRDYRPLTIPLAALIGGLSVLVFGNTLEMLRGLANYYLYAGIFQFLLPLILFLAVLRHPVPVSHRTGSPG